MKKSKVVFRGKVFSVTREEAREPGGVRAIREVVRHPGSAVVLAERADGRLLLIRQFRFPARKTMWEAVAGRIDEGETPLEAARRELAEEASLGADTFTLLGCFFASPGFMDERMWLYLARGLHRHTLPPDVDERIRKRWFTPREVGEMIRKGRMVDSKSTLCYFLSRNARS